MQSYSEIVRRKDIFYICFNITMQTDISSLASRTRLKYFYCYRYYQYYINCLLEDTRYLSELFQEEFLQQK